MHGQAVFRQVRPDRPRQLLQQEPVLRRVLLSVMHQRWTTGPAIKGYLLMTPQKLQDFSPLPTFRSCLNVLKINNPLLGQLEFMTS